MDEFRHAIERMTPRHYISAPYFERYLTAIATLLIEKGIATGEELEPAPRRARREPRRGADHAPAVEHLVGAAHPRLPLERAALRGDPARLAARPLRTDDAPAGR
jgi:Nitrile hydratase beta subunit, N-terminal